MRTYRRHFDGRSTSYITSKKHTVNRTQDGPLPSPADHGVRQAYEGGILSSSRPRVLVTLISDNDNKMY